MSVLRVSIDAYTLIPAMMQTVPRFEDDLPDERTEKFILKYFMKQIKSRETEQDFKTFLKMLWMTWSSEVSLKIGDTEVSKEKKDVVSRQIKELLSSESHAHGPHMHDTKSTLRRVVPSAIRLIP
jgi:hypothetical protein